MARRKRKEERTARVQTRKEILRERKSAEERRTLLAVLVPVLGVALALIVLGALREGWFKPRTPVASVDGNNITAGAYAARIEFERLQLLNNLDAFSQYAQVSDASFLTSFAQQSHDGLPTSTVDKMIEESLIREEAAKRGITVTDDEVTQKIYSQLPSAIPTSTEPSATVTTTSGITTTATVTPTATLDDSGIASATKDAENEYERQVTLGVLQTTGISEKQYREIVRNQVYRDKLQEALAAEVPITDTQVDAQWLRFDSAEVAQQAADAITAGSSWDKVLQEYSPPGNDSTGATSGLTATGLGGAIGITTTTAADATGATTTTAADATGATEPLTATNGRITATDASSSLTLTGDLTSTAGISVTGGVTETAMPSPTPLPWASQVGDRGWLTRQKLKDQTGLGDAEVSKVLALEPNTVSEPITVGDGTYLVFVFAKDDQRTLDKTELDTRKSAALSKWLDTRKVDAHIDRFPLEGVTPPEPAWFTDSFAKYTQTASPTLDTSALLNVTTPTP